MNDIKAYCERLGKQARAASRQLAASSTGKRNTALLATAEALISNLDKIETANRQDLVAARDHDLTAAMLDRLNLGEHGIVAMAKGLRQITTLADPVGGITDLQ